MEHTKLQLRQTDGTLISQSILDALKREIYGRVITPVDIDYEEACRVDSNSRMHIRPGLIVKCATEADVVKVVRFARQYDIHVAVKGGGHSAAVRSIWDDGIAIDLSLMRHVQFDQATMTVRAEGGALTGDITGVVSRHKAAVSLGMGSKTGVAGLTLGAEAGWLARKYGLACDNLICCRIVTANGEVLSVDATTNSDLFWALRGGYGNFGILTSLSFQAYPIDSVLGGLVFFPSDPVSAILEDYRDVIESAPDELTASLILKPSTDGVLPMLLACYCGDPRDGKDVLDRILSMGRVRVNLIQKIPFDAMERLADSTHPSGLRNYSTSTAMASLPHDVIEELSSHISRAPSADCQAFVQTLGGEMSRAEAPSAAFAQRDAVYKVGIEAQWEEGHHEAGFVGWADAFHAALKPFSNEVVRPNFTCLLEVKKKYDPENFFSLKGIVNQT